MPHDAPLMVPRGTYTPLLDPFGPYHARHRYCLVDSPWPHTMLSHDWILSHCRCFGLSVSLLRGMPVTVDPWSSAGWVFVVVVVVEGVG